MTVTTHEPGWYDDPWVPHAKRWWDGKEWTGASLPQPRLRNAGALVPYVVAALLLAVADAVASISADVQRLAWIADARAGSVPGLVEAARRSDRAVAVTSLADVLLLLVAGVLWLVWFSRLYHDAGLFRRARFPRWAVWGWLVPFASLVRPKQMVNDAWAAGDETQDLTATPRAGALVHLWWAAWLVGNTVSLVGSRMDGTGPTRAARLDALRLGTRMSIAGSVLDVVAAVLAVYLVLVLTRRIEARGRAAGYLT
jgi:hypothetical protein